MAINLEKKQVEVPKQEASQSTEVTQKEIDTNSPVEQSDLPIVENSKVEVVESPQKKKGILKWVIIVIVILGFGYLGMDLYLKNQLLQSSLEETKDLYQQELNTNHEEILMEIYEEEEEMSVTEYKSYIKINDPDGYTNVRSGKSSSTEIIHQIYDENKLFKLIDDSGNWWEIKLDSEKDEITTGFIHNSKVLKVESFTVVVNKAYFYLKADEDYQNRAYLIQDDQLFCHSNIENNFRNCTYINSKGDTTIGYIKMNQLKRR